jgi:hypothetical protein
MSDDPNAYHKVDEYLNDLTTFYHAEKIREWIESKVKLN